MTARTPPASNALSAFDARPYFDKALHYGVTQGIITPERLQGIQEDFAKGIVQIANFFSTAHLRPELELALKRMVNLISLYLEDQSGGDLRIAAASLRDRTFLSHSKGGSDMLKRLNALPDSTMLAHEPVTPERQRAYLEEKTASQTISLADYQADLALRQAHQRMIDFSLWLARKLGLSREETTHVDDADSLIRSAMLVLFVDKADLKFPTRTVFVQLIKTARNMKTKPCESRLNAFLKDAPADFEKLARQALIHFIDADLTQIRAPGITADKLLYGETAQVFFVSESLDEDVREYDRLVAREWDRVTRGDADDPAVLATVFLFVATGLPPKATMLLKEAREVIRIFRSSGFDAPAVLRFIAEHAPEASRDDLKAFWEDDLKSEAETQLADSDPSWPDSHMERAADYLRKTCCAAWKGRRR
jgi:hypothetical protein